MKVRRYSSAFRRKRAPVKNFLKPRILGSYDLSREGCMFVTIPP